MESSTFTIYLHPILAAPVRARDTTLDRDVAIKVLPDVLDALAGSSMFPIHPTPTPFSRPPSAL